MFNETQATGIPINRNELELAGLIIPKAKRRDNYIDFINIESKIL
jgi:hypothetical protein